LRPLPLSRRKSTTECPGFTVADAAATAAATAATPAVEPVAELLPDIDATSRMPSDLLCPQVLHVWESADSSCCFLLSFVIVRDYEAGPTDKLEASNQSECNPSV
jgi:hypothetical protein